MPKVVSTSPLDSNNRVVCFAHNLEASRKTSQTQSNPARDFYCCSKPFSDPDRCKFFYWAEQIDSLRPESQDMNNSPRKRVNSNDATGSSLQKRSKLGDSMSAAQTPAQKRLKEIQKVLGVAPCLSSDDEEDEDQVFDPSQHATQSKFPRLLTPPSTSSRQNLFLPQSPSPLPRNGKGKEQDMSNLDSPPPEEEPSVSDTFYDMASIIQGLAPKIAKLERQKTAAEKGNAAKANRIAQLTEENEKLKRQIASLQRRQI